MLGIEKLPREMKLALRYTIMAFGVFVGGLLWLWGMGNIHHDARNHAMETETKTDLGFRNF